MFLIVLDVDYDIRYWRRDYEWNTGTDSIVFNLCGIVWLPYSRYNTGYQRTPEEWPGRSICWYSSRKGPRTPESYSDFRQNDDFQGVFFGSHRHKNTYLWLSLF